MKNFIFELVARHFQNFLFTIWIKLNMCRIFERLLIDRKNQNIKNKTSIIEH